MTAVLSLQAQRDLVAAGRWIAKTNPAAARALRQAVVNAAERIGEHPHVGKVRPELAGSQYRFIALTGFPYIIVYNAERQPPLIARVLHGARNLPRVLKKL